MPFFLDGNPTQGEISEAINYLLSNFTQNVSADPSTGQIIGPTGGVQAYLYRYIQVKYADSFDGSVGFSNTPTNKGYYGLRNTDSSTESTNPADYLWTQVTGGFGTTKLLYYTVTGGRQISIIAALAAPSALWQADSGSAIDLDVISGSDGASSRICYAKSTSTSLASTPTTYQTTGSASFPPTNTWGGAETWQATPPTLAVNEALFQSDGVYNPMTNLTTWNVPYLSNLKVGALSAISANLGSITAGSLDAVTITGSTLTIGSSPAISGTTMSGSGTKVYTDGRFAMGNSSSNIVFNGTSAYLNGFTATAGFAGSGSSGVYWPANTQTYQEYSSTATLNNVEATKPVFIFATGQLGLGCTSVGNAAPPARVDVTYQLQYQYSTNGGGSYSAWTNYGIPIRIYAISANYTSVSGYNRNFFADGAGNIILTPAANTTNIQFRLNVTYVAYGDNNATTTGYFGPIVTGSLTQVDTTYTGYSISTFQIKA